MTKEVNVADILDMEYYEEAFLKNKFFEYKADFAAKGCTEEEAEKAAAEALLQLADALDKLEM
tara:strand:+ start:687 stop:875 length:189 start_codon:yes stop_codon:yes gene_type:complete